MTWDLDLDDFNARFCQQGTYPLHRAMIAAAGSGGGPTDIPTTPV